MSMSYFQAFTPQNPKNWGKELQRERSEAQKSISQSINPLKSQEVARAFPCQLVLEWKTISAGAYFPSSLPKSW